MSYKQIGNEDYLCIGKILRADYLYSGIARTINKNVSSVSRHIRQNGSREKMIVKKLK